MIELAAARFPGARGVNVCRANSNSNRKGKTMKEEETTIGTDKRTPGGIRLIENGRAEAARTVSEGRAEA